MKEKNMYSKINIAIKGMASLRTWPRHLAAQPLPWSSGLRPLCNTSPSGFDPQNSQADRLRKATEGIFEFDLYARQACALFSRLRATKWDIQTLENDRGVVQSGVGLEPMLGLGDDKNGAKWNNMVLESTF